MATREDFLKEIWKTVIDPSLDGFWIGNIIASQERDSKTPFSEVAPAVARLLDAGADPRDLSIVRWFAAYEAVFGMLYLLDDPGIDGNAFEMLYEELLTAAPDHPDTA